MRSSISAVELSFLGIRSYPRTCLGLFFGTNGRIAERNSGLWRYSGDVWQSLRASYFKPTNDIQYSTFTYVKQSNRIIVFICLMPSMPEQLRHFQHASNSKKSAWEPVQIKNAWKVLMLPCGCLFMLSTTLLSIPTFHIPLNPSLQPFENDLSHVAWPRGYYYAQHLQKFLNVYKSSSMGNWVLVLPEERRAWGRLLRLVHTTYKGNMVAFETAFGMTGFQKSVRLHQGSFCSPFLLIFILDVMTELCPYDLVRIADMMEKLQ